MEVTSPACEKYFVAMGRKEYRCRERCGADVEVGEERVGIRGVGRDVVEIEGGCGTGAKE